MSVKHKVGYWLKRFEKKYTTFNLIEVSRSDILHNLETFEQLTKMQVMPVLKANAYGHGIKPVADILKHEKVPYIAVDGYFEALRLREASRHQVLVMGAIPAENYKGLKYDNFSFVVQDEASIRALGKTGEEIDVHLECNTGMNRSGADPSEVTLLTKLILSQKKLNLEGVMSHLADSDGSNSKTVEEAIHVFDRCVEMVREAGGNPTMIHVAQTAGSLVAKSKYANMIRLGIGLYGLNPFPLEHPEHKVLAAKLRPALRLTSTIAKVTDLKKGDKVSYNYTYVAPQKMQIGLLPLGYYEALPRNALSNKGRVKIDSTYAPIVGLICMNQTMIGLHGISAKVGDKVVVYSNDPTDKNSIDNIAREYGLFNYELLARLSRDVRRRLVD